MGPPGRDRGAVRDGAGTAGTGGTGGEQDEHERNPRVVVGVDHTLAGLQALRFAVAEARGRGSVILPAIRAWQFGPSWYGPDASPRQAELVDAAAMTIVTAFREALGGAPKDILVEALVIEGAPAVVLTDQAHSDRDLLVVGRSRRRRFGLAGGRALCADRRVSGRCRRGADPGPRRRRGCFSAGTWSTRPRPCFATRRRRTRTTARPEVTASR